LLNTSGQHVSSKKIANLSMEYENKIKEIKEEIIKLQEMIKN
jgi:phage host-nuclease inhibitor protein Gam